MIPLFAVTRGTPTAEELAALTAVLVFRGGAEDVPPPAPFSQWSAPESRLRRPVHPVPGAWKASAWR